MILIRKFLNWVGILICGESMDHQWAKTGETFTTDHYVCKVCEAEADVASGFAPHPRD
jgi:hypothetical protein